MSFEGFYRYLCKKGHLWENDVNCDCGPDAQNCPYCNGDFVWTELVDTTNGTLQDEQGNDLGHYGETQLIEDGFEKQECWSEFGEKYHSKIYKYLIPDTEYYKKIKEELDEEQVGYVLLRDLDFHKKGDVLYFTDPDGITSYVSAHEYDSNLIPAWLCNELKDVFAPIKRKDLPSGGQTS